MNPSYGSAQTISTETDSLVITAQTTGLSPGTYSAVIYVSDSGPAGYTNMLRIPVSFTVAAGSGSVTPPAPTPPPATPPPTPPAFPMPSPAPAPHSSLVPASPPPPRRSP